MKDDELNYYVSALYGDDTHTGKQEQPFRSIERARNEVRTMLQNGCKLRMTVWIGEGSYYLNDPLSFDEQDSGNKESPITYRNVPDEKPVIVGGQVLSGWEKHTDHMYRIHIGTDRPVYTLFENGVRSVTARSPKAGYHTVAGKSTGRAGLGFSYAKGDIPEEVNPDQLQVHIWPGEGEWNWFTETKTVASIDREQAVITLKEPAPWGIDKGSRYWIQGALALLTEPGEFYWDGFHGNLYYYPKRLPIEDQLIIAPTIQRVIELKGTQPYSPVRNLIFEGLTMEISNFTHEYRMPHDNYERSESCEGLIHIENAEGNTIRDCTIRHSGYSGILLRGHCQSISIIGNTIEHLGYHGIYAIGFAPGEGEYQDAEASYVNKKQVISRNVIRFGGELVGHGSGIQLYQSGDNVITHNRIYHMPRYGLSLKGLRRMGMTHSYYGTKVTWDNHWDFLHSRNNLIAYNDISDVMKDSQDGGMLESWGAGRGNQVIYNRFHHSGIYFSYGFCIYLDDASDDFYIANNVIHDLFSADRGILWFVIFAKGVGNRIENNLLVRNQARAAIGTQEMVGEANRDITVNRNIVCDSGEQLYHFVNWDDLRFSEADYNLFYRSGGEPFSVTGIHGDDTMGLLPLAWQAWRQVLGGKFDQHTLNADPQLLDVGYGEFALHEDSPAYSLGWQTIDMKKMLVLEY